MTEKKRPEEEIQFGDDLPVLPIRNAVLFPGAVAPFDVGREKSVALVEDVDNLGAPIIAIFAQKDSATDDPGHDDLYQYGCAARVLKALKHSSGNYSLILQGISRIKLERMNQTAGQILVDGNAAAAMGCMFAGVTVVAWYPITPSSSLPETLIDYMRKYRMDKETGKATFAIVQAEDEIAALGMVLGATWAGARAMTSTSGPGISLMSEFAGLAYYSEVPAVVFDIQRIGPSTGLPTRTSQGDLLFVALHSHGDTRHVMLLPASVQECYEMSMEAFDLAERLQTIIYVMSDLDLGMNTWMSEPFTYPDKPMDRGKVLDEAKVRELGASWGRYKDIDGDGIAWRSLPGTGAPAYFTRGSGHNEVAQYTERPDDYVRNLDRLVRKYDTARTMVPRPIVQGADDTDARVGIIGFGSSHWAIEEARDQLREESGLRTAYLRLRAYPFTPEVDDFIRRYDRIYVVEQNRDAQMLSLLLMDGEAQFAARLRSVLHYNGLPIDARSITDEILEQEQS